VTDWLQSLWDQLTAISVPLLLLGLAFQTAQTCLVALAWHNILRAAYPDGGVRYRRILSYYAGGTGLNSILPASAGTFAMLGLFRSDIAGSTVPGLVAATVVQSLFFAAVSAVLYLCLFLSVAGSFDVKFEWFSAHPVAGIAIVVGGIALIVLVVRIIWRRSRSTWEKAKEGGGILTTPRKFMVQVVGVEALSYLARMGVNATFMHAYGVPVSLGNVFLIVAASSISSTIAILPGAVGAQTGLATVVLRGEAPASVITAYTVGQSLITTAWNVLFGFTLLASVIGWRATRQLVHVRKRNGMNAAEAIAVAAAKPPDGTPSARPANRRSP
jgi:uncharacterized membrane protein YbhN (UPF0104 family)